MRQRILNTVRYTDDVVRELIETLRREPWFERTLIVINSDHGYNLGEHGGMTGAYSLYRESVWTPFLIVGPHPRLPAGRHDEVVTLLDVAPTIADLIGLREANPWHGHSLLSARPGPADPVRLPRFAAGGDAGVERDPRRPGRAGAALRRAQRLAAAARRGRAPAGAGQGVAGRGGEDAAVQRLAGPTWAGVAPGRWRGCPGGCDGTPGNELKIPSAPGSKSRTG